jgi:hypothetical protein
MKPRKYTLDEKCAWMRERQADVNREPVNVTAMNLEVPLTVKDASPLWGQSQKATRRHFAKVDGVRLIQNPRRYDPKRKRWVRKYDTVLIPPSVLQREIRRTTKTAA